jgi:nitrite reductase/ring-hydroxylating ferredoxin subunit
MLCVANVGGRFYALDNVCPHQGAALGQGTVEHGFVVCPWHGWQVDPASGVAEQDPECIVDRYTITMDGQDVFVSDVDETIQTVASPVC